MYYVYIIQSSVSQKIYIGFTSNIERINEHNLGMSQYTKGKGPWHLIYFEAFKDRSLAIKREKSLKYFGKAYGQLKRRIGLLSMKGAG